jgi:predicted ATPase
VTDRPHKLCLIASASGHGKTTLGRAAGARVGVALIRRTARRMITREELWNGNRESLRSAVWGREI